MNQKRNEVSEPDPLIDEVRGIRRSISDRYGNDVDRLYAHLRDVQRQYAGRIVSRKRSRTASAISKTPNLP